MKQAKHIFIRQYLTNYISNTKGACVLGHYLVSNQWVIAIPVLAESDRAIHWDYTDPQD